MMEAISRKEDAHRAMSKNSTEGNRKRYERMKNKVKQAPSKAMGEKADETLFEMKIVQVEW